MRTQMRTLSNIDSTHLSGYLQQSIIGRPRSTCGAEQRRLRFRMRQACWRIQAACEGCWRDSLPSHSGDFSHSGGGLEALKDAMAATVHDGTRRVTLRQKRCTRLPALPEPQHDRAGQAEHERGAPSVSSICLVAVSISLRSVYLSLLVDIVGWHVQESHIMKYRATSVRQSA
jgi:hypothetical protein